MKTYTDPIEFLNDAATPEEREARKSAMFMMCYGGEPLVNEQTREAIDSMLQQHRAGITLSTMPDGRQVASVVPIDGVFMMDYAQIERDALCIHGDLYDLIKHEESNNGENNESTNHPG